MIAQRLSGRKGRGEEFAVPCRNDPVVHLVHSSGPLFTVLFAEMTPEEVCRMTHITKDSAYNAVAPDDFPAMMEVDRYGARSTAFDSCTSS